MFYSPSNNLLNTFSDIPDIPLIIRMGTACDFGTRFLFVFLSSTMGANIKSLRYTNKNSAVG